MGIYSDYQSKLAPPAFQGPNGTMIETTFGAEKDTEFDRARQGLLSNLPDQAPPDALDYIGDERMMARATTEAPSDNGGTRDQAYAERLRTVWDSPAGWSYAGSHGSLLYALDRAGFPMGDPNGCHIIQRVKRYSWLTGSGGTVVFGTHPGWTFDGSPPAIWNQFGLIFGADFSPPIGSVFQAGDPSANLLNSIVAAWKPVKARFMGTQVMLNGPWWDWPPGVNWNDPGRNWGDGISTGTMRFVPPV
jgi:hypothetical protein